MKINLAGDVDFLDVYRKLTHSYFDNVERLIRKRLSPTVLSNPDALSGAGEVLDSILKDSVHLLSVEIFPGLGIFWDEKVGNPPTYDSYPCVIVDVVDGAKELRRGGTEVTSTLGIIRADGQMPLAIVSYPFGHEKIVDIEGEVYRLPNDFDFEHQKLERYSLKPRRSKDSLSSLYITERYEEFTGKTRERLDALRYQLKESIKRPVGSIAKMIVSVATGPSDILISKKARPERFYDYFVPSKIVSDIGGTVTDLDGKKPDGISDINGIIAASTIQNYNLFYEFLNR